MTRIVDVGLVGSYPPPHGGQSVHIQNLWRYLRGKGMTVEVFNTGPNKGIREEGLVNVGSSRSLLSALLLGSRFKLLHAHVSNADDYRKLVPVGFAALARGSRWVATIHSGNSADRLRVATPLRRTTSGALLARADRIICVNSAIHKGLANLVKPGSMVVIPPFSLEFGGSALPGHLESFFADHLPTITCSGLYEPLYGFDHAVSLMNRLRDLYPKAGLLLIGDMRNAHWCRTLISELGLESNVKLCGNLGHEECLAAIGRSTLFLRPTHYDGDSLSVREALALGVRVVASATDFRPDGVILYQPGVLQDLVAKVLTALEDGHRALGRLPNDYRNLEQVRQLYLDIVQH